MILRVGLTGGIASGKSTVSRTFAGLGCLVIDADKVVADLYRPGAPGYEALVETYGPEIVNGDGEIDRPRLASIAFSSEEEAQKLNALIHPLVIAEEFRLLHEEEERFPDQDRIAIVEATLLLESGGKDRYDRIVVVDLDPEDQVRRAVGRGMAEEEARRRMSRQMPREKRLALADYVIDNSGEFGDAETQTFRVYDALLGDLERKKNAAMARD
jgi:dephospho-CoA kinase